MRKLLPPTTDQKPGHRPLSFSSGGDLGSYRAVVFRLFFVAKNHLHFYCQNLEKTMVFGGQIAAKMASKIQFFESWRALVSDLNFRSIFYGFFIDFWKLESLKIVLPPKRNAYFCKIDVFALNQKNTSILESKIH